MNYLFVGEETQSKDIKLKNLKSEILPREVAEFNCDTLYASDLTLKELQEKLQFIPVQSAGRVVVIRQAGLLKDNIREFLAGYLLKPYPSVTLILDIDRYNPKDAFIGRIARHVKIFRFQDRIHPDAFMLHRQIGSRRVDSALKILKQLLEDGQKPEMILGGLRYCWQREAVPQVMKRKKLRALLNCDIEIKTGKLKANFSLEKLVLKLCSLSKAFS